MLPRHTYKVPCFLRKALDYLNQLSATRKAVFEPRGERLNSIYFTIEFETVVIPFSHHAVHVWQLQLALGQ